ncbi:phosphoenolpyruvate carboxykinase [Reticulomyxa filosa]|uniref:phosphoenolpyruvate carboxykinase (ATP) n=1 Tax=Reticulomyxa filosa TaxID=46433 RepID=X6L7V9_RETFI|nr:phosphoenolpyruvate carboxykinase [Reticulomyxa filosa]|eukprot:ETN97458.1 phosphoenolpyruvate carboxykinase [Reticulomyxa filosa]
MKYTYWMVFVVLIKNRVAMFALSQKKHGISFFFFFFCEWKCIISKVVTLLVERGLTEQTHHHFVKNMFIRPNDSDTTDKKPDFTVFNCWNMVDEDWKKHGLNSEVFVTFNLEKKIALIGGAWYGGEMKKGIFSMMHYWLPMEHCLSMHCSANIGEKGDTCLFFGLSGTGKTTLSTDPKRRLIGDDEHGWDDEGIFNFEGGCYAKTSKLSRSTEPEIYDAIRFNSLLENVWVDPLTRDPDYFNLSITENGRVSYPIEHIQNREPSLSGNHPNYIIFLCADAFGVLPPIAKLSPGQAMYHFVSGYTAKVAGTERGIKEPVPNFSSCYGAAFLTLHPLEYAKLLKEKLEKHKADCYLVNTGWTGGPYGVGQRMGIKDTRACLDAIFDGSIKKSKFRKDDTFLFEVPESLSGVDPKILNPKNTWTDKEKYDQEYKKLAKRFADNIALYAQGNVNQYKGCGPI